MPNELKIEYLKVDELKPYEKNTRKHDEKDVDVIANSIQQFGMNDPIGIWGKENLIVEGHGRLLACKKLGFEKVPCIRLDDLTDEQRKAYAIAHNRSAELSEWNDEFLKSELADIKDLFPINDLGFDFKFKEEKKEITDDNFDFDEEVNSLKNIVTKKGDLWILGDHRLYCGDSTHKETIETLVGENTIDLFLTDPPYNVDYEGKTEEKLKISNDSFASNEDYTEFLSKCFSQANEKLKAGGAYYIFFADKFAFEVLSATHLAGWNPLHILVWKKDSMVLGRSDYQYNHEPFLYGWKEGGAHLWNSDRKQLSCMEFVRPKASKLHPTMKPLDLIGYLIQNSSLENQNVLDLFGGSGSTLIACEQLGRKCYTVEIEPRYCDVIIKRWETLTGKKAILVKGGNANV